MKVAKLASMDHDAAKLALRGEGVSASDLIDLRHELDVRLRKTRSQLRKLGKKCRKDESDSNVTAYDNAIDHLEAWQDLMGIVQSEQARRKAESSAAYQAMKKTFASVPEFYKNFYRISKTSLVECVFKAIREQAIAASENGGSPENELTGAAVQA